MHERWCRDQPQGQVVKTEDDEDKAVPKRPRADEVPLAPAAKKGKVAQEERDQDQEPIAEPMADSLPSPSGAGIGAETPSQSKTTERPKGRPRTKKEKEKRPRGRPRKKQEKQAAPDEAEAEGQDEEENQGTRVLQQQHRRLLSDSLHFRNPSTTMAAAFRCKDLRDAPKEKCHSCSGNPPENYRRSEC